MFGGGRGRRGPITGLGQLFDLLIDLAWGRKRGYNWGERSVRPLSRIR